MKYHQHIRGIKIDPIKRCYPEKHHWEHKRGIVTILSKGSRRRLEHVYMQYNWKSMVTLTYHNTYPDHKKVKKHFANVKRYLNDVGIKYLWVVEFQKRGFPHFHLWLDRQFNDCHCNKDKDEKGKWKKDSWRRISQRWLKTTGQIDDEQACSVHYHQSQYTDWEVKLNHNYATKYASKMEQKGLPPGCETFGRWWGSSNDLEFDEDSYTVDQNDPAEVKDFVKFRRQVTRYLEKVYNFKIPKFTRDYRTIKFTLSEKRALDITRLKDYFLCLCPEVVPF